MTAGHVWRYVRVLKDDVCVCGGAPAPCLGTDTGCGERFDAKFEVRNGTKTRPGSELVHAPMVALAAYAVMLYQVEHYLKTTSVALVIGRKLQRHSCIMA